ncbi:hypothetical protein CKO20_09945 [Rhodocyclus tenuis]|nr:hypothetical protein [Rhodocyclus tenuis]
MAGVRVVGRGVDCQLFDPARRSAELRCAWGLAPADGSANAASPSPGEAVALARSEEPAATGSDCTDKSASADGLAVIYVGRLAAEKNLDLVLRAFVAIHERHPDARLVLVGDGPWRGKLTRRFAASRRNDAAASMAPVAAASAAVMPACAPPPSPVVFAGQRSGEDLAAHYASGDLFLFPSLTETFGNVTQEALASGLAVLAFRSAAAAELIVDGENGRTVAVGDDAAFIRAALQLAREPAVRRRLGQRARQSVIGHDWSGVAEQFANTLREAIGGD